MRIIFVSYVSCRTSLLPYVPVVLKRHHQPNAQVLDRIPTTGAKDAAMQKDPNVSPQSNQTTSAKTRLTMSSHERKPTKRCQECLKLERERESYKSPPEV